MNTEINSFQQHNEEIDQKIAEIIQVNDDISLTERNDNQTHDYRNDKMSNKIDNKVHHSFNQQVNSDSS